MSTIYEVVQGDTFESIARKKYGDDLQAFRIPLANPGLSDALIAGLSIIIPDLPGAPFDSLPRGPAANPSEVSIVIDGLRFRFWTEVAITRRLDGVDTFSFNAPFEPDAPEFKSTFVPFSFKTVSISVGGQVIFNGTMVQVTPELGEDARTISIEGYSLPGVLSDCMVPAASLDRLSFQDQNIQDIATALAGPFGITVVFDADPGSIFEFVDLAPDKKLLPFLIKLAQQRNLIIGTSPIGELVFFRAIDSGDPVARLNQGTTEVRSVTPTFRPQEYYSHITGIEPAFIGTDGSQFTVANPRLEGVIRPFTYDVPDTLNADIKGATEAKAARMFGGAVSYSVAVATWRDPSGALWVPNTILNLTAPGAMIYEEYSFLIRSVRFSRSATQESAVLELVIPGAFSGTLPEAMPWDV